MLLERRLFFMYFSLCFFRVYSLDKVFVAIVLDKFFSFGSQKSGCWLC